MPQFRPSNILRTQFDGSGVRIVQLSNWQKAGANVLVNKVDAVSYVYEWQSVVDESEKHSQAIESKRPVLERKAEFNNNRVLVFDGVDDFIQGSGTNWSSAKYMFAVFSVKEFGGVQPLFGNGIIKVDATGTILVNEVPAFSITEKVPVIMEISVEAGVTTVSIKGGELTYSVNAELSIDTLMSVIATDGSAYGKLNLAEIIGGDFTGHLEDINAIRDYLNIKYILS